MTSHRFLLCGAAACLALPASANAEPMTGLEVAQAVDARFDGNGRLSTLSMELTNKRGQTRTRVARVFSRDFEGDVRRLSIFFTEPAAIAESAFATLDNPADGAPDAQWLYLPATERVRAIPASERGDAFMGTDFSYDDIKTNLKLSLEDYTFDYFEERAGEDGVARHVITAAPVDAETARALGYGGALAVVNADTWMVEHFEFTDVEGEPLKSIDVETVELIDDIWTATRIRARNLQTDHTTVFTMTDIDYRDDLDPQIFDKDELEFGAPVID